MILKEQHAIATLSKELQDQLPEAVKELIAFLLATIESQKATIELQKATIESQQKLIDQQTDRIQQLEIKIHDLEARLSKNSSNSSKPPGSDGLKKPPKPKSLRGNSGKTPGGQKGHKGTTLNQVPNPDRIIIHSPQACHGCGHNLAKVEKIDCEKRQVFDIPEPKTEVTEHQAERKQCPCCGKVTKGVFPNNVCGFVQYGTRIQAMAVYFLNQHLLPSDRLCQIFKDVFQIPLSEGTCFNINKKLFKNLESFESDLKTHLLTSKILHFDETGVRCNKKLNWIHVTSNTHATFYGIHLKRGLEAMNDFDILPSYKGIGIHDHWFPYFTYEQMVHSLCNAHHLRELTYIFEQEKEDWADELKKFLIKAKRTVEENFEQEALSPDLLSQLENEYLKILNEGFEYHAGLIALPKGKRGRQKQRPGKNLLNRLRDKKECVLRFMYNFDVPFTNNLGEQDIRMVKLKEKISGCFRCIEGGQIFCRIRSYISTARKQKWKIIDSLILAIKGEPKSLSIFG